MIDKPFINKSNSQVLTLFYPSTVYRCTRAKNEIHFFLQNINIPICLFKKKSIKFLH